MILPLLLALSAAASAEPASSAAGSVVRSKEWVVRRGLKREEEFIGDVRYDAAGTNLAADWALYRQAPNDWQARGNITARRVLSDGGVLETAGETAQYNQTTMAGTLEPVKDGRLALLRTPPRGGPDHAEGDHLSWEGERTGTLSGRVRGWGPRGEFWAASARVDRASTGRTLTLAGERPVAHNFVGAAAVALRADRIVLHDAPRRSDATGRVAGWVLMQSSATSKGRSAPARCGKGERLEGAGPDENVSSLLAFAPDEPEAAAQSRFWGAEAAAFAARACPWGPRVEFWADEAKYDDLPDERLVLSGGRPVVRRVEADSSAALKADAIVAFAATRRVKASGGVKGWMTFKEDDKHKDKKHPERKQ